MRAERLSVVSEKPAKGLKNTDIGSIIEQNKEDLRLKTHNSYNFQVVAENSTTREYYYYSLVVESDIHSHSCQRT